jgi:hypothetical protein
VFRTSAGIFFSDVIDPRMCAVDTRMVAFTPKGQATPRARTATGTACEIASFDAESAAKASCEKDQKCAGYYVAEGPSSEKKYVTATADPASCRVDWRPFNNTSTACTRLLGPNYSNGDFYSDECRSVSAPKPGCPFGFSNANGKCTPPCKGSTNSSDNWCTYSTDSHTTPCIAGFEVHRGEWNWGKAKYDPDLCVPTRRAIETSKLLEPLVRPYGASAF